MILKSKFSFKAISKAISRISLEKTSATLSLQWADLVTLPTIFLM